MSFSHPGGGGKSGNPDFPSLFGNADALGSFEIRIPSWRSIDE
jgi:hypothetical protein